MGSAAIVRRRTKNTKAPHRALPKEQIGDYPDMGWSSILLKKPSSLPSEALEKAGEASAHQDKVLSPWKSGAHRYHVFR